MTKIYLRTMLPASLSYTNRGMAKDYSLREMQILPLFR